MTFSREKMIGTLEAMERKLERLAFSQVEGVPGFNASDHPSFTAINKAREEIKNAALNFRVKRNPRHPNG